MLLPVKYKMVLNLNAVILFQHVKGSVGDVTLDQRSNTHEIGTINLFQLSKDWSAELGFFFPGSQAFCQDENDAIYNISGI